MKKLLIPLIIIAILIILFLLWSNGMFGGSVNSGDSARTATPTETVRSAGASEQSAVTSDSQAAMQPRREQAPPPPSDAEIVAAADALLANHRPDLSQCEAEADSNKALECAAAGQSAALSAAFEEHNALRSDGDRVSVERGGEVMRRVIALLQQQLAPFVQAADGS